jgi:hypothetical protein
VVVMNSSTFWDIAPCSSCVNRRFGGTYGLHLQGRKSAEQQTSVHQAARQNDFAWPTERQHKKDKSKPVSDHVAFIVGQQFQLLSFLLQPYMLSRSSVLNTPIHNSYIFNQSRFGTEEHLPVFYPTD